MKAFPSYAWNEPHKQMMAIGGMDLRDYFAAKAMQADITRDSGKDKDYETIAERSYQMADAMMKAREK
jgi:hypothetical protein